MRFSRYGTAQEAALEDNSIKADRNKVLGCFLGLLLSIKFFFSCEDFPENNFAPPINRPRARARMAQLGLIRSRAPGIHPPLKWQALSDHQ